MRKNKNSFLVILLALPLAAGSASVPCLTGSPAQAQGEKNSSSITVASPDSKAKSPVDSNLSGKSKNKFDDIRVKEGYGFLLQMQPAKAILRFCGPLTESVRVGDYPRAARIMRLIAFAFRLDENDQAAARCALAAAALDANSDNARLDAADYLFRCGQWKESEKLIKDIEHSSDRKVALRAFISECMKQMQLKIAIERIAKEPLAIQNDPKILMGLAYLYNLNEQPEEAAQVLRRLAALSLNPYMKEIIFGRADIAARKFDQAEKHFLAAASIFPEDPLWHTELGLLKMKQGEIPPARKHLEAALAKSRMSTQAYVNYAVIETYFGSVSEARRALKKLAQFRPHATELAFAEGVVAEKENDRNGAKKCFYRVIDHNPYNSSAYVHLLKIEREENNVANQKELAHRWLKACPMSFTAYFENGKVLFDIADWQGAIQSFNVADGFAKERDLISRKSTKNAYLTLLACRAVANLNLKKENEAIVDATSFNQLKPEPNKAGGLYIRPPRLELEKLAKGSVREAAHHAFLGDVLYENQKFSEAESQYANAIASEPDNILWHSCRLKVLMDKKDLVAAAKEDLYVSQHMVTHIPDAFK